MKRWRVNGHWAGWFYDETWRANIEVIWPVTGPRVQAYLKSHHGAEHHADDNFSARCVELMDEKGHETNVICLKHWSAAPSHQHRAMLAHEIFHAADHVLSKRGITLCTPSSEAYAYFIESITTRVLTLLDTRRALK